MKYTNILPSYFLAASLVMLGTACSQENCPESENNTGNLHPVTFSVAMGRNTADSRTQLDEDGRTIWTEGDNIQVKIGQATNLYKISLGESSTRIVPSNQESTFYWEYIGQQKNVTAWHPSQLMAAEDGKGFYDQRSSEKFLNADLLKAEETLTFSFNFDQTLLFYHQLTKLSVQLVNPGHQITDVKLVTLCPEMDENGNAILDGKIIASTTQDAQLKHISPYQDEKQPDTYYALVVPGTMTSQSPLVIVTIKGQESDHTVYFKLNYNLNLEAGCNYQYTLHLPSELVNPTEEVVIE